MKKVLTLMLLMVGVLTMAQNVTYNMLQNVNDLNDGDSVLIAAATENYVMGVYASGNNIARVAATKNDEDHTLTAPQANRYVVVKDENGIAFRDSNNAYLTNASTSSKSKLQALTDIHYWNVSISDGVAAISSKGNTNRRNMLYNKGASCFACYDNQQAGSILAIALYSNNAPAYQEKVLHPAMEVTIGGVAVGDTLDWGEVVYDDSWGTEAAPYSEMKTLTVQTTDLTGSISVSVTGNAFSAFADNIPANGGQFSVNFETNNEGTYLGTLTLTYDTIVKAVVLKAKAVREASEDPSTKPTLTVEKYRVYMNPHYNGTGTLSVMDMFTFSATNLSKTLFVEWVKNNTEPTSGYGTIEVLVGDQLISAGEKAQFDGPTVEETEVYISVDAYGSFSYSSQLHFYTYADKTTLAAEYWVDLVIDVTTDETPDPDPTHDPNVNPSTSIPNVSVTLGGKVLHAGQVRIVSEDGIYDLRGNRVE